MPDNLEWEPEPYDREKGSAAQWVRRQISANRAAAQEFAENFAAHAADEIPELGVLCAHASGASHYRREDEHCPWVDGPFGAAVTTARWTVRRVLAVPIWQLCSLIDRVPWWFPDVGWQRCGCLGCYPLRLSRLAIKVEGQVPPYRTAFATAASEETA